MIDNYFDIFNTDDNFSKYSGVKSILIKSSEIDNPHVTFFIPTYKRATTLCLTLDSILGQEGDYKYEILIVDNNPDRDDETELIIRNKYGTQPQLSYYKNSQNIGMVGNFNRGYELAQTEWVIMIHDDDLVYPDYLKRMFPISSKCNADAIFCGYMYYHGDHIPKRRLNQKRYLQKIHLMDCYYSNPFSIAANMLRKSTVMKLGGFNELAYPCQDYHLFTKIVNYGNVYKYSACLTMYRIGINESLHIDTLTGFMHNDEIISRQILSKCHFPKLMIKNLIIHVLINKQDLFRKKYNPNLNYLDESKFTYFQRFSSRITNYIIQQCLRIYRKLSKSTFQIETITNQSAI